MSDRNRQALNGLPATGTRPLASQGRVTRAIDDAEGAVDDRSDQSKSTSLGARTTDFDQNVNAWASPDKRLGEGRANPAALTEDAMVRDGVDGFKKGIDNLTGGDGSADGEHFDENMKREVGSVIKPLPLRKDD